MADDDTIELELDEGDDEGVEERVAEFYRALGLEEFEYPQVLKRAIAHATAARASALTIPAGAGWLSIGPRNVGGRVLSLAQDPVDPLTLYAGMAHGGLWRTRDAGDSWDPLSPPGVCVPVGALAIPETRPDLLYMGTGAQQPNHASGLGFYVVRITAAGAANFVRIAESPDGATAPDAATNGAALRYTRIRVDPDDPLQFWVGSQTGLWRGRLDADPSENPADPPPHVVLTRDFPINPLPPGAPQMITQADASPVTSLPSYVTDLLVCPDPSTNETIPTPGRGTGTAHRFLIFVMALEGQVHPVTRLPGGGIFRARFDRRNGTFGAWTRLPLLDPAHDGFGRIVLAQCRRQPRNIYAVYAAGSNLPSAVSRSSNLGDSWDTGQLPVRFGDLTKGQAHYDLVLEVNPFNPQIVYMGEVQLYRSSDAGQTLEPIIFSFAYNNGDYAQHEDQHALLIDHSDHRRIWAGNDGGISMARDASAPALGPRFWRKRSHGIVAGQFYDIAVNPAFPFMCGGGLQDNGNWVSYGGTTWFRLTGADGSGMALDPNPRQIFLSIQSAFTPVVVRPPGGHLAVVNPVLNDLPDTMAPDHTMRVGAGLFRVAFRPGPFVKVVARAPIPPDGTVIGWNAIASGNSVLGRLPAGNFDATVTGVRGEETSAAAFGPLPVPIDSWVGTTLGNLFRSANGAAGPWAAVAFPRPNALARRITGIAVHPTDPTTVAVASVPAESGIQIVISTGGALTVSQFRIGPMLSDTADVYVPIEGTSITLSFPAGGYVHGDHWVVHNNATVTADAANGSPLILAANSRLSPVVITFTVPGGLGTAQFTVTVGGLPVSPTAITANDGDRLKGTQYILRFQPVGAAPLNFAVGDSWTLTTGVAAVPAGGNSGGAAVGAFEVTLPFTDFDVVIAQGGAQGIATFFQGVLGGAAPTAPEFPVPGSPLTLKFAPTNYIRGDIWSVFSIGFTRGEATNATLPVNAVTAIAATQQTIAIRITKAGALGVSQFSFQINGLTVNAARPVTAAEFQIPGTYITLQFTAGDYHVNDSWTVNPATGAAAVTAVAGTGHLTSVLRNGGRVHLSYDRGVTWTDITYPLPPLPPRPELPALDLDALSPGPISKVQFDFNSNNRILSLFAGSLAGMYGIEGVNRMTIDAVPPGNIPPNQNVQLRATLHSPAGNVDVSTLVEWSTSNAAVAQVGAHTGLVHTVAAGDFQITATRGPLPSVTTAVLHVAAGPALPAPAALPAAVPATMVWRPFNPGLPLCLVNDIETVPRPAPAAGPGIVRIATFGRGVYDCNLQGNPNQRLHIRQNLTEDGLVNPGATRHASFAALPDDPRVPAGVHPLTLAESFDIRVDASTPFQFFDDRVDGVEFDEDMPVDNLKPLVPNSIYVQVHTRGSQEIRDALVYLYFTFADPAAPATDGIPNNLANPNPVDIYTAPNFTSPAFFPATWRRIDILQVPPLSIAQPRVVRFDFTPPAPPAVPANARIALLALVISPSDLTRVGPPAVATVHDLIDREPRAALRIVPLDPVPAANLYIRDGVDEVAAFGEVVFGGRSPDIIVKQAVVDHPVDEFKDLLDQRPQDTLSLVSDNHVYVRVQNRGVVDADVTLNLYAFPMSAENQPVFTGVPGAWVDLANPPLHLIIPARGLNYLHVVVPGASLHPVNPNDPYRAFALVALIQAANDPPANLAGIVDVASFWSFFRELPRADNAAIRVLRAVN